MSRAGAPTPDDTPSADFRVSIKDAKGNVIEVSRAEDATSHPSPTQLTVAINGGRTQVSWEVGGLEARGFALYRSETGKEHFQRVVDYLPNFGEGSHGIYTYQFTDRTTASDRAYDYRLEVLTWGVQTASVH